MKPTVKVVVGGIVLIILMLLFVSLLDTFFPIPQTPLAQDGTRLGLNSQQLNEQFFSDAPVTIVEFSDFQCPYCASQQPILKKIKRAYGDQVNILYKHIPLPIHPFAQRAAEASECARDQDKFWEYHDLLFDQQDSISEVLFSQLAQQLGLSISQFNQCLASGAKKSVVQTDLAEAQSLMISGTPTFFINGQRFVGVQSYEELQQMIDQALAKAQQTSSEEKP